uniref:Uncharacterized protein n=1 Tax=Anopheles maculatus TaxID=74869 RepID=A0A182SRA3_9DIPT
MRWKLLLLLFCAVSLISLSTNAVAEEYDQEQDDATGSDDDYDAVAPDSEDQTEPEQSEPTDGDQEDTDQKPNEDLVDIDTAAVDEIKAKQGRYYNYDDFMSSIDLSDSNYNWEGKSWSRLFTKQQVQVVLPRPVANSKR